MNEAGQLKGVDLAALQEHLHGLWNRKEQEEMRQVLASSFSQLQEPLAGLLELLGLLEGFITTKKSKTSALSHLILAEFMRWRTNNPEVCLNGLLEEQRLRLQQQALGLLTDSNPGFIDPLLEIYQLSSLDTSLLLDHVAYLHDCCFFKEAVVISVKVQLQGHQDMEKMCVPLILLDKMSLVESYVRGHSDLQQRLVKLLDSWCSLYFDVKVLLRTYPQVVLSKHQTDQLHPKLLSKHIFRLMEKFDIDPGMCPNAVYKRKLDSLKFLMYKTFGEKTMSEENWSDHVQVLIEGNLELQIQLVHLLVRHNLQAAAQWAVHYGIPRHRLSFGVRDQIDILSPSQLDLCWAATNTTESWTPSQDAQQKYYQLPLAREDVVFVQTLDELEQCRGALLKAGCVVGIDMEWRAAFGTVSTERVALIQLAVQGRVFLLDLCAHVVCQNGDFVTFFRALMSDKSVLKLGYGLTGDFKCLVSTWPELKEEPLKVEGVLDLLYVHQELKRCWTGNRGTRSVDASEAPTEKGLCLLVQEVLGKPLDKIEQLSNWERRPLRLSQLRYAAADAYCLLDVFRVLSQAPEAFGLPEDLHSISSAHKARNREEKKAKEKCKQSRRSETQQKNEEPAGAENDGVKDDTEYTGPTITPRELRVVCDNMLQGLGRFLRCLGVDVKMLENTDDHKVAAELARAEQRVILTSGQPYQTLRSQVGEGWCMNLDCSEKARDQAVRVLRHFHIYLTPEDIFSRCQACNCNEYFKLSREEMTSMMRERGLLQDAVSAREDGEPQVETQADYNSWRPPEGPEFSPHCHWAPHSALDPQTFKFPSGAEVQLETVPPGLLLRIPVYFICTGCGKVFWEGTHYDRVLSQFQEVLHVT